MRVKTYSPYAYESVTVADTAVGLTGSTYLVAGIKDAQAFLTLESGQIRWRIDGADPTASEGHLLDPGQTLTLYNLDYIRKFKAIRTGSTSGVLKVTYLKQ
jgi:hypothetical protein